MNAEYRVSFHVMAEDGQSVETKLRKAFPKLSAFSIAKVLTNTEERTLVRKHADADFAMGRDWNGGNGCACGLCREYRGFGLRLAETKETTK